MTRNLSICLYALILFSFPARADHSAGGELIYEHVRDSTYRFYLKFYRDCAGIQAYDTIYMCYFNSCNGTSGNKAMPKMASIPGGFTNGQEVNPGCPGVYTNCTSLNPSALPGYREWWYSCEVTLPSRCDYWTFYVSVNARNRMDNLTGTIFENLYLEATLNNKDAQGFSSPYFTVKPVPYVCVNEPHVYSSGPVDPDGDSLSFDFIMPRTTPGLTGSGTTRATMYCPGQYTAHDCTYRSPFTLNNPFATANTFVFDATTGLMRFTPTAISANTLTMQVSKWRGGRRLATVIRDIQLRVITCQTFPASLDVLQASVQGAQYVNGRIEACAGTPFSFCFNITSASSTALLLASDNHTFSIPGSGVSYSNQGTSKVLGCFSWQPPAGYTGLKLLAVTVKDSACRAPGVMVPQTFIIPIYIKPVTENYVRKTICLGDTLQLTASANTQILWSVLPGGASLQSLSCTNCKYPVARPDTTTTYIASYSTKNTCTKGDTFLVRVNRNRITAMPDVPVVFCAPDSLQLSALATGPRPYSNLACGVAAPPAAGAVADTVNIVQPDTLRRTPGNAGSTPFNGSYTTARHQYLLRAEELRASGMISGTLTGLQLPVQPYSGATAATFDRFTIALGCTDRQSFDPSGNFIPGTVPVYTAPAAVTLPQSGGVLTFHFDIPYNWDTTKPLVVDLCYANAAAAPVVFTPYYATSYDATLYSYNISGDICAGDPSISGGILLKQIPAMRLIHVPAPEVDFAYTWSGTGGSVFFPDTLTREPVAWVPRSAQLYVQSEGRGGCIMRDTVDVYIPVHTYRVSPDTAICLGSAIRLYAGPGHSCRWYEDSFSAPATLSCATCADPVATPAADVAYTVVITDSVGCADTLGPVRVHVVPVPDVQIQNSDTTIGYGESVQLQAGGATRYLWTPATGLSNAGAADPVASPKETATYVVQGSTEMCHGRDTITIYVDIGGKVFVPSAFTPNGDGVNDVFRVGHITFQAVQEFRVFNRWGEEVFHTIDPREGWDGTWKGQPQEMGTYFYLIRLGYPDGSAETYQGDVTLIR